MVRQGCNDSATFSQHYGFIDSNCKVLQIRVTPNLLCRLETDFVLFSASLPVFKLLFVARQLLRPLVDEYQRLRISESYPPTKDFIYVSKYASSSYNCPLFETGFTQGRCLVILSLIFVRDCQVVHGPQSIRMIFSQVQLSAF